MSNNDKNINQEKPGYEEEIDSVPIYKNKSVWIGIFAIIIVSAIGIYWFVNSMGTISTDDAFIDGNRLNVSPKILGRIVNLHVDERDSVKAGQLVAELDSVDLVARLNQTKAILNNAEVSIQLSKVNVEKAQIDFDRASAQYKDNVIPKADYDNAQKKLEAANVEFKIAQSRISTAQADLKVIESNLNNTKLYSTIDGVVAKRWILEGDVAQPGQPIFTIYDMKNLWVTAQLEETKIHALHLNDEVEISVDAYPDKVLTGKVYQVGTNTAAQFSLIPPSNASGNFTKVTQRIPVKISLPSENGEQLKFGLLPGMSVEVSIKEKKND